MGGSIDFKYERNLKMAISIDRFTKKTHHVVKKVTKVWFQINAEIFRFWKISKIFDFWNLNWAYLKWKKSIQIKLIPLKCQTMNIRRVFKKMPDRLYWGKSRNIVSFKLCSQKSIFRIRSISGRVFKTHLSACWKKKVRTTNFWWLLTNYSIR